MSYTTETWAPSPEHPGYRIKTIKRGACTIQILRPELEVREEELRTAHLKAVAETVLRDYYNRKEKVSNE